jgi:hypothetical protein
VLKDACGRLAQVDRALVSGTKGRAFESRIARHSKIKALSVFSIFVFLPLKAIFQPYFQPSHANITYTLFGHN